MSDEKLLEVVDLQAGYNGMAVVHDVSFSVREGEILAILGSNGSGKTHHPQGHYRYYQAHERHHTLQRRGHHGYAAF